MLPGMMGGVITGVEPLKTSVTVGETSAVLVTFTSTPVDCNGGVVTTEELLSIRKVEVAGNSRAADVTISMMLDVALFVTKGGFANDLEEDSVNPPRRGTRSLIDDVTPVMATDDVITELD